MRDRDCTICGQIFSIRYGMEPTDICDACAQAEVERLNEVLASIHAATDLATARRRALEGRTKR